MIQKIATEIAAVAVKTTKIKILLIVKTKYKRYEQN